MEEKGFKKLELVLIDVCLTDWWCGDVIDKKLLVMQLETHSLRK